MKDKHGEPVRERYRQDGRVQERERILKAIEETFFPLDYSRWQADELLEEIERIVAGEDV